MTDGRAPFGRELHLLREARVEVVRLLDGAGADALARKPAEKRWSALEIFEHLVLAERYVLRGLPDPATLEAPPGVRRSAVRRAIVAGVLRVGIPVQAPSKKMVPAGTRDFESLKRDWDDNEAWIHGFVGRADRALFARPLFFHPVAGALTFGEAVRLDRVHVRSHLRRIRELLAR